MKSEIKVKKRNGSVVELDLDKIHLMVEAACAGISGVSASQVEMSSGLQFYDGISTEDIQQILIKSASDLISLEHPGYQYVAARLLLFAIRKQIYGGRIDLPHLEEHINQCVAKNVYDHSVYEHYSKEEIDKLNSYIDHDRDFLFTYAGLRQVVDKYLVQDRSTGELHETPQFMYMMIALTVFKNYPKETRLNYIKRYYDAISRHKINLPTPIAAGIRTNKKQGASCTLIRAADDLDSIIASGGALMKYVADKAGIGLDVGQIRALGSKVRGGETISTGLVPYLKFFQGALESVHQGGLRKGSMTVFCPIWHLEIEQVIVLKNNKGNEENRVRNIDYAIGLSKLFYERFIENGVITLFCPNDVPGLYETFGLPEFDDLYVKYENDPTVNKKQVGAQELIIKLLNERSETGRVYIFNIDHANSHSSFLDKIYQSNLCVAGDTEIFIKIDEGVLYTKIQDLDQYLERGRVEILSYNYSKKQNEWKPITAFAQTNPNAEVVELTNKNNDFRLVLTPDHEVYVDGIGYVKAKDLKEEHKLILDHGIISSDLIVTKLPDTIPVYDITVSDNHNFFANGVLISNCVEITLPTEPVFDVNDTSGEIALCVLGAVNVGAVKSDKELEEVTDLIVRGLDELIDFQDYVVPAAEKSTRARRSLGVGVIGLAHYLAKLGASYEEQAAWDATHQLAESLQYYLLKSSVNLAKEKGACEYFYRTKYSKGILPIDTYKRDVDEITNVPLKHDWEELRKDILTHGLRNSTLSAYMPSESSSIVSNATNGIEPPRELLSVKRRLKQIVPQYSTLKNNYTTVWDMKSNVGYFNVVAVLQKFCDQTISANWNYNPEHYPDKLVPMSKIVTDFLYCYKVGHKTAYYLNTYDGAKDDKKIDDLIGELLEDTEETSCDGCTI
jgi:ribonucleotide reductase alpha subunit